MDIKGIGNEISNIYSSIGQSKADEVSFEAALNKAIAENDDKQLQDACEDFEAYYVQQLFKEMKKTLPQGGLFEDSTESRIYEDMLDEKYSDVVAKSRGIGIADALYKQLKK